MLPISRVDKSEFINNLFRNFKEASISRIDFNKADDDPFERYATNDVWYMAEGKLIRDNAKKMEK